MLCLCLANWNYWNKPICSQDPSSCNLCWDITSFLESHSNTRWADQPYLIAKLCVCVFVCILGSSLRTGCLAPYVRSVRGNWENKVLRGPLCYCYLLPPWVVFEDRKYESDRSPRGMWQWFIRHWPLTYPLHPRMVSHTHSLAPQTHSPGPKFENRPAQPDWAQPNPGSRIEPCTPRFVWVTNEKQMDSGRAWEEQTRKRKTKRESCKIFVKKNNPGMLSNYIYLSCVVLLGRLRGHPCCCTMVIFFTLCDPDV